MFSIPPWRILWFSVCFQVVNALNAAIPYEAVYFYNAYKMEYAATIGNEGARTIMPGCTHRPVPAPAGSPNGIIEAAFIQSTIDAGVPGICSFEDFLRGRSPAGNPWKGGIGDNSWRTFRPPPVGNPPVSLTVTLEPDADLFAARALNPGTLGNTRLGFKAENLLSDATLATYAELDAHGNTVYPYGRTITKVSDAVQSAREAVAAGTATVTAAFDTWRTTAITVLEKVGEYRIGDNSRFFVPAIQADPSWTTSPMNTHGVVNHPPFTNIAGNPVNVNGNPTWQQLDYDASIAAAESAGDPISTDQVNALKAFGAAYGSDGTDATGGKAAKVHRDVIDSARLARTAHQTPITIESDEPDAKCGCCIVM